MAKKKLDKVDLIMAFEGGDISEKDLKRLFQEMVNTGEVWGLQGMYGRTASAMLKSGFIKAPTKKTHDFYGNPIPTRKEMLKNKIK